MTPTKHFNPRSHEGSDTRLPSCFFSLFYFNPRSHEGSDTNMSLEKAVENISIHAPTRGATAAAPLTTAPSRISIHAPTRGATYCTKYESAFQYFNPRSHEGSDVGFRHIFKCFFISIHAPTRGATRQFIRFVIKSLISIHAPTRGATRHSVIVRHFSVISIHAPTRGATPSRRQFQ